MNFGSHVDGVVAASVVVVNLATPGERQGRRYAVPAADELCRELSAGLSRADRSVAAVPASRATGFGDLAAALRPVFEAVEADDRDAAAARVNDLLRRYTPDPVLERHDGEPWHLHFHGAAGVDPSGWGAATAMGLASVLGSEYADRLGVCAAPACDRVFVDVSRNGTRRFCGEPCQNRVKAAAHRARVSWSGGS